MVVGVVYDYESISLAERTVVRRENIHGLKQDEAYRAAHAETKDCHLDAVIHGVVHDNGSQQVAGHDH